MANRSRTRLPRNARDPLFSPRSPSRWAPQGKRNLKHPRDARKGFFGDCSKLLRRQNLHPDSAVSRCKNQREKTGKQVGAVSKTSIFIVFYAKRSTRETPRGVALAVGFQRGGRTGSVASAALLPPVGNGPFWAAFRSLRDSSNRRLSGPLRARRTAAAVQGCRW